MMILPSVSLAGWKENYREKYSKKTLDPNSDRAKKIRRIGNMDIKFLKWTKTPEERKALGLKTKTKFSEYLMPWKRGTEDEKKDSFVDKSTNFSHVQKAQAPAEDTTPKTGYTLTETIRGMGKNIYKSVEKASDEK